MLPGTPKLWLIGSVVACVALFLGASHLRYTATISAISKASEAKGTATADARHASATVNAAAETAAAERAAEAEVQLPEDRAAIIALCKRSASCKERHTLK